MPANVETMMSVREVPWHGLGTIVDSYLTADKALKAAGLDWTVTKEPVFLENGAQIPSKFATVRSSDHRPLGIVGSHYVPFQNEAAFSFLDTLTDSGDLMFETAGAIGNGAWVWVMAKFPSGIMIGGVDPVDLYLLVSNRHDGLGSITAAVTPTRVVCSNTLNLALRGAKREWRVRHVANAESRIQEARAALDLTFKYAGEFEALGNELVGQTMSANAFGRYLDKLSDELNLVDRTSEDMQDEATRLFVEGESLLDEIRQTKWAALNAVSEYFEHARKGRRISADTAARQNWYSSGTQRAIRRKALALLS